MLAWIIEPFAEFGFMQRALAGCLALSLSASPVGVFLMLRRMSLTGDAMAHAVLPGAAVGFLVAGLSVEAMTLGGLVAGCLVALLSGTVARLTATGEDSSMAAFYLISLALGVLLISSKGSSVDLLHVLFGAPLALNDSALYLLGGITTVTLLVVALMYRPLVMECLDPRFLRSVSGLGPVAHFSFLLLLVLNLVGGFHALGTLMSVGLMILPAAAARFWVRQMGGLLLLSFLFAFASCVTGLLISYYVSWPTSSAIILTLGVIYLLSVVLGANGGLLLRLVPRQHLRA